MNDIEHKHFAVALQKLWILSVNSTGLLSVCTTLVIVKDKW